MDCIRSWRASRLFSLVAATTLTLTFGGCAGLLVNLLYEGPTAPASYGGLEKRRVAVVCVSSSGVYGPSNNSMLIAKKVEELLRGKVKDITVIEQQQINDWIDKHDWDQMDYLEIGRGVKAEMMVAIDVESFSTHDSPTFFKGKADVKTTVYDMTQNGKMVFSKGPVPIVYPKNGGYHSTDTTEVHFRRKFITELATQVAKYFYAYPLNEDFAVDTPNIDG